MPIVSRESPTKTDYFCALQHPLDHVTALEVVFQCTSWDCQRVFVGFYENPDGDVDGEYMFADSEPKAPVKDKFSPLISQLSPAFVKIHLQAMAAETYELDQIVGIGLRRALEFLIKDFAIYQHPTDSESIKLTRTLSTIINKYCDDVRIKTAAERAAWFRK